MNAIRERNNAQMQRIIRYFGLIMSLFYVLAGIGIAYFQFPFALSLPYNFLFGALFGVYGVFRAKRLFTNSECNQNNISHESD